MTNTNEAPPPALSRAEAIDTYCRAIMLGVREDDMNTKTNPPPVDPAFVLPTRDELLAICRDAFLPQEKWSDRDTARCQQQLGEAYALLMAGCDFTVRPGHRGMMLDIRIEFRGFSWFEGGFDYDDDRDMYLDHEDYYAPTRERLDAVDGGDWYC